MEKRIEKKKKRRKRKKKKDDEYQSREVSFPLRYVCG
jgi:hypothetical protein